MSNLADRTERAAILTLATCLKNFDKLSGLNMTSEDAFSARAAENLLRKVIETNEYTVHYQPGKGTRIVQTKK